MRKKIKVKKIAILLNDNARNVNSSIKKQIEELIPRNNIFYTKSLEEADATIAKILNMDFTHVFTGGGDGTLVYFINKMKEIKREAKLKRKLPIVGVLKLGTGNAIAIYTNSGKKIADDVKTVIKGGRYKTQAVQFIKVDDQYFTFGGFGDDALILNDYDMMKRIKNPLLRWPFLGLKGYFTSGIFITFPKLLFRTKNSVKVYANTDKAYTVSKSKGIRELHIKKGDLIFEGEFTLLSMGTTSYYGYGLKILPYASKKEGFFHLRISNIPTVLAVPKILQAWNGLYESSDTNDFLVDDVILKFENPAPLQIAGDPAGYKEEVRLHLSEETVDFIQFKD